MVIPDLLLSYTTVSDIQNGGTMYVPPTKPIFLWVCCGIALILAIVVIYIYFSKSADDEPVCEAVVTLDKDGEICDENDDCLTSKTLKQLSKVGDVLHVNKTGKTLITDPMTTMPPSREETFEKTRYMLNVDGDIAIKPNNTAGAGIGVYDVNASSSDATTRLFLETKNNTTSLRVPHYKPKAGQAEPYCSGDGRPYVRISKGKLETNVDQICFNNHSDASNGVVTKCFGKNGGKIDKDKENGE